MISSIVGDFKAFEDITPFLKQLYIETTFVVPISNDFYEIWRDNAKTELIGYLTQTTAQGYRGIIKVITLFSSQGILKNIVVAEHRESRSILSKIERHGFLDSLKDKPYTDPFNLKNDVDGISGATYTCRALTEAIRKGTRLLAQILNNHPK